MFANVNRENLKFILQSEKADYNAGHNVPGYKM